MSGPLRYAVLGTGSRCNSYIFSDSETTLLVDNGFSCTQAVKRIREAGFDPKDIDLIAVTHGHSDHIKGVADLSHKFRIPVHAHPDAFLGKKHCYRRTELPPRKTLELKSLSLFPFEVSHDAPGSMGYHFRLGGRRVTLLTDTGRLTEGMKKLVQRSDLLFLEANYCPKMLESGPYPPYLKRRIDSQLGHLSNPAAVAFLNQIHEEDNGGPEKIYFCHLSDNNNSPERLTEVLERTYEGDIPWIICPKNEMVLGDQHEETVLQGD